MSVNHYLRWVECYICGELVQTTAPKSMCPECREMRVAERARERNKGRIKQMCIGSYIVEYDPDTDYGFRVGAIFGGIEIAAMLVPGISAFTPGTRLKNARGEIFVVKLKKLGGEKLVPTS